jgi:acyl carrier protein
MSQGRNQLELEGLSRADVLMHVCSELAKVGPLSHREIHPDSDFVSELNIDSLDAITVVLALNSRFGVDLPNITPETFRTPQQMADAIINSIQARQASGNSET